MTRNNPDTISGNRTSSWSFHCQVRHLIRDGVLPIRICAAGSSHFPQLSRPHQFHDSSCGLSSRLSHCHRFTLRFGCKQTCSHMAKMLQTRKGTSSWDRKAQARMHWVRTPSVIAEDHEASTSLGLFGGSSYAKLYMANRYPIEAPEISPNTTESRIEQLGNWATQIRLLIHFFRLPIFACHEDLCFISE